MKLTTWGAAQQVTGSMHLLEIDGYKILVDCGLDYEHGNNDMLKNEDFPFSPTDIDLVVLTHAHIDHSGNIPTLVRKGFAGQVLCTAPTARLGELLMLDSVNIFMRKERRKVKRKNRTVTFHNPPLYLQKHVMETADRFVTIAFKKPFHIKDGIQVTFIPVGHLLGAAAVVFEIEDEGKTKRIAFTGDIGRKGYPILQDPEPIPQVDYLISESTYGGRWHSDQNLEEVLLKAIEETCIKTRGKLIIPAFSIGRTQALVYSLNRIFSKGLLPMVKIFVDSPLANYATEVYRRFNSLLNQEAQEFYAREGDQFSFDNLRYVEDLQESQEISNYYEPCIIISSAGMLEGGRIQDHLYNNIQNYYCTILFIGYCAPGTLGNRLLRGDPIVKLRHRDLSVFAKIQRTDALSGHGDHNDLVNNVLQQDNNKLKNVFLVHGEPISMEALKNDLEEKGYRVEIPMKGQTFVLG
ncbi:MBL fold metallo-hydrolase [Olivibacter sitiensis]|uniref:MBL fold metallo-hydrolase n=1 Tax=Olivibacter sitiensis TaxID=376470 RepID=UPI0004817ADA|nr:MBL fold metallo-hydrolase [Olivibacter sitiensis]